MYKDLKQYLKLSNHVMRKMWRIVDIRRRDQWGEFENLMQDYLVKQAENLF